MLLLSVSYHHEADILTSYYYVNYYVGLFFLIYFYLFIYLLINFIFGLSVSIVVLSHLGCHVSNSVA